MTSDDRRPPSLRDLNIKIFADSADIAEIVRLRGDPLIQGFTTNPTLMRNAGVRDYGEFAREIVSLIPDRPISLEVFADEFEEMERQAHTIASWGENVYVKIPVTNTKREPSLELLRSLAGAGIQLNVTALTTLNQVREVGACLDGCPAAIVSVFAGRVADTGRDPVPMMSEAASLLSQYPAVELLWASPREILNIFQADSSGCGIVTVTPDLLAKLKIVGKDLDQFSLETVQMFYDAAAQSGYKI